MCMKECKIERAEKMYPHTPKILTIPEHTTSYHIFLRTIFLLRGACKPRIETSKTTRSR